MRIQRSIGILVCALVLALALFPQTAAADSDVGILVVDDISLCEDYDADKKTGTCTPYTDDSAVYDLASNTLTLTNFEGGRILADLMGSDFRIVLVGDNKADGIVRIGGYLRNTEGLDTTRTDVSISGAGSLCCAGIHVDNENTLEISGGVRITSTGHDDNDRDWLFAVWTGTLLLKDDSQLIATGGDHYVAYDHASPDGDCSFGVSVSDRITVTDNAKLIARGGEVGAEGPADTFSIGIRVHILEVISGTVEAYGGLITSGSQRGSGGIGVISHWTVPDGLNLPGSIEISGGKVIASGNEFGMAQAPDLSGYARYRWKTEKGGAYVNSDRTPYTWDIAQTYTEIAPIQYAIIKGQGGEAFQDSTDGLGFTADADYDKLTGVFVDGREISDDNYTARSGSTIITLKAAYLKTLSVGKHTLRIGFADGYAEASFTVLAEADVPATGDPAAPILWLGIALMAGAGLAASFAARRRRQNG